MPAKPGHPIISLWIMPMPHVLKGNPFSTAIKYTFLQAWELSRGIHQLIQLLFVQEKGLPRTISQTSKSYIQVVPKYVYELELHVYIYKYICTRKGRIFVCICWYRDNTALQDAQWKQGNMYIQSRIISDLYILILFLVICNFIRLIFTIVNT